MMAQPTPLRAEPGADETYGGRQAGVLLALAMQALQQRVLMWLVTAGTGAVWTIAALHPDTGHIVAAVAFSACVFWPILWHDLKGGR